jgi:hypothetical protein
VTKKLATRKEGSEMIRFTLVLSILASGGVYTANTAIAERGFEECQALAISRGVPSRYTHKVESRYLQYKAAGTALHPKGLIARCMSERS